MTQHSPASRRALCRRALGVVTGLLSLAALAPAARAASLGNVMPLGDSITQGTVAGGYRDPLYTKLTAAGYTLSFVGSTTVNPTTALTNAGQARHEGHSGYVIQSKDPTDPGAGSGRAGILDNINSWLGPVAGGGADPQYILLMIGTNDVDLNYFPATQQNRLDSLVTRISNKSTGLRPNANLIVAQISPILNAAEDVRVNTFNAGVAAVVASHQALGENVSMVDMHSALQPTGTYMGDNLHPNQTGYNKMADVWVAGIQAVPEPGGVGVVGSVAVLLGRRVRRGSGRRT